MISYHEVFPWSKDISQGADEISRNLVSFRESTHLGMLVVWEPLAELGSLGVHWVAGHIEEDSFQSRAVLTLQIQRTKYTRFLNILWLITSG